MFSFLIVSIIFILLFRLKYDEDKGTGLEAILKYSTTNQAILEGLMGVFGAGLQNGVAICLSYKDSAGLQATTTIMTYGKSLQGQANEYLPSAAGGTSIMDSYTIASSSIGE